MKKLEKLNSSELNIILKGLKLYRDLSKKLGNRGKSIFNKKLSGEDLFKVEYISTMNIDNVWEKAEKAFEKAFSVKPDKKDVVFIKNNTIFGGIKIFKNDDMVDLSLSKAIDQIK